MSESDAIKLLNRKKRAFLNRQRAVRENCKKSTGPKDCTVVRANSVRHGLRSNLPVIPGEDQAALKRLRETVYDKVEPVNDIEIQLAEQVVLGLWRMQRGIRAEQFILDIHGDLEKTHWDQILDKDYLDKIAKFENHAANQLERAFVAIARLRGLDYFAANTEKDNHNVAERKD